MSLAAFAHSISPAPVVDHLWQSTLVTLLAALLVLALRRHRAGLRYWVWFVASMKFLLPFALLIHLGQALRPAHAFSPAPMSVLTQSVNYIAQPFSQLQPTPALDSPATHHFRELLPYVLLAVWFCGTLAVALHWARKRRRILHALRTASPSAIRADIPVLFAASSIEPGVFGLFQPVLLLPVGIAERLSPPQLRAVIAHEMCHVRRRDNLTSALHMLVEALFWFHPLVWWIGACLVDERERACDEHVLALGSDPQVYAESILKVCNFYLESPLFCAAGVTGSHLKKRIEAIMIHRIPQNLRIGQKLLLAAIAAGALIVPFGFGILHAAQSVTGSNTPQILTASFYNPPPLRVYESVSVTLSKPNSAIAPTVDFRPDGLTATNVSLQMLIQQAYGVAPYQIAGAPDWLGHDSYDVEAKVGEPLADELAKGDVNRLGAAQQPMLLELLADRFHLAVHRETRQLPAFALVVSKTGSKLHEATPGEIYPVGPDGITDASGTSHGGLLSFHRGRVIGQGIELDLFIKELSGQLGRPVLDQTGLTGKYDFTLQWSDGGVDLREYIAESGNANPGSKFARLDPLPQSGPQGPSIFTALHDQLGLDLLESQDQTAPVQVLVIDRAGPPANDDHSTNQPQEQATLAFASVSVKPNTTDTPMAGFNIKRRPGQAFSAMIGKPDRFMATRVTLHQLIRTAYKVQDGQIAGGPDWLNSEKYDVEAVMDQPVLDQLSKLTPDQRNAERGRMLQALLADHFNLTLHRETRDLPTMALVVTDAGIKFQSAKPGDTYANGMKDPDGHPVGPGIWEPAKGQLAMQGQPIAALVKELADYQLHQLVVDNTGLTGNYDLALQLPPEASESSDRHTAALLAALPEQLGLKLEQKNAPVDVLVIDHADQPPQN
jgi:bla regulator protein blaR1